MTIRISAFTRSDLPAVVRLLNEEYRDYFEFIPFSEERVLSQIRRRRLKVLVAEENGKTLGVIGTHSHENSEEDVSWLAASKEHKREDIEDFLVGEVEKTVSARTISTMIDAGSPKINEWINRGYTVQPGYQRMSARLEGLIRIPSIAEGVKLRSLKLGEEEELVATVNAGFGWKRLELEDLNIWKSEDPPFNEEWVQVAELDQRIVSVVVARPDTDSIKYLHLSRGYLGPAATLPEFRNKHLASALTARAMNFLFEKGMTSVRLGTSEQNVSSVALLRSLSFQVDVVRKTLRKELESNSQLRKFEADPA